MGIFSFNYVRGGGDGATNWRWRIHTRCRHCDQLKTTLCRRCAFVCGRDNLGGDQARAYTRRIFDEEYTSIAGRV